MTVSSSSNFRVLLPKNSYPDDAPVGRQFQINHQSFVVIDRPSNEHVNLARNLVRQGQTAGWLEASLIHPQAIFFDMDATVIAEESLVEIAKAAGKFTEVEDLTTRAMEGGMDFAASLRLRLSILKGTSRETVLSVKAHLNPGIRELAAAMHRRGVKLFLVSGGFMDLAEPVSKDLNFLGVHANRFAWNGNALAGDVDGDIVDSDGKRNAVLNWCQQYGLDPKCCIAVGDGANDRKMMDVCGLAVGFMPKKALWDVIGVCNGLSDHRLLLELLTS